MIDLEQRIKAALNKYCGNKYAMHVPPKDTDVDVVLSDCLKELESLKAQLEAKSNANKFLDGCRIEWHELAMRKDEELQEVKAQLAQYQSDDCVVVKKEPTKEIIDNLKETMAETILKDDEDFVEIYKAMIEAQEQHNAKP